MLPKTIPPKKRNLVFQPPFFIGYVLLRGGNICYLRSWSLEALSIPCRDGNLKQGLSLNLGGCFEFGIGNGFREELPVIETEVVKCDLLLWLSLYIDNPNGQNCVISHTVIPLHTSWNFSKLFIIKHIITLSKSSIFILKRTISKRNCYLPTIIFQGIFVSFHGVVPNPLPSMYGIFTYIYHRN